MYIGDFVAFLRTPLRQNARLKAAVWHTEDTNPGRHHHHQLKNRARESWKRQFASNNMSWPPFWRNVGRYGIDAVYVYAGLLRCGRRSKMEEAIFTRRGCRCLKYLIKFSENASFICFLEPEHMIMDIFESTVSEMRNNAAHHVVIKTSLKIPKWPNRKTSFKRIIIRTTL